MHVYSNQSTVSARLPAPRGPLTRMLVDALRRRPGTLSPEFASPRITDDPLYGEDVPLALYVLYELHYRGFDGVDDEWEWDPDLLTLRRRIERAFLLRLEAEIGAAFGTDPIAPRDVATHMRELASGDGPSLSAFMAERGTIEHMRDFAVHRSLYQRKEADPHTWAIPRLAGSSKAALVEIQADEYGNGREEAMHSELFADTMRVLGLSPRYGAFLDVVPGATLSTVNLVSLFGLHRRWRGALIGHLALFEMCSVVPMTRYVAALERLNLAAATPFYAAHVVADEWHQQLALEKMVGGLVADEPHLSDDIVFGARALDRLERDLTNRLLHAWSRGGSSLRDRCA
jgi:Iron-containing redox enzyme